MRISIMMFWMILLLWLLSGVIRAQSLEQKVDILYNSFVNHVTQKTIHTLWTRQRAQQEKRLWKRIELSLKQDIRKANFSERVVYQSVLSKVIEQNNPQYVSSLSELLYQRELINAINNYRATKKLPSLQYNSSLMKSAYRHALDLAVNFPYDVNNDGIREIVSHRGTDNSTVLDRVNDERYYYYVVENIAYNQLTAYQVLQDWIHSPTHYVNLIDPTIQDIGIAKIGQYRVMVGWKKMQ